MKKLLELFFAIAAATIILQLIPLLAEAFMGPDGYFRYVLAIVADALSVLVMVMGVFLAFGLADKLSIGEFHLERASAETKKLMQAIDASYDGVILTDAYGVIRHVNPQWVKITGWSAEETVGRMTPAILKSGYHDSSFYSKFWLTIQNGKTYRGELINKCKDGSFYRADEIAQPILDERGRISGYVAFHRIIETNYKPATPPPFLAPPHVNGS